MFDKNMKILLVIWIGARMCFEPLFVLLTEIHVVLTEVHKVHNWLQRVLFRPFAFVSDAN